MSDIDPLAGWDIFSLIWIYTLYNWKLTSLLLVGSAFAAHFINFPQLRKWILVAVLILLAFHLINVIYFQFFAR